MSQTKVLTNLASVSDMVGTLAGVTEEMDEDRYVEQLILEAHIVAKDRFDESAAATAATGRFAHMYEFGTPGITPGKATHNDPTGQDARLWVHKTTGKGGNIDIWFDYRPAVTRNPQPTTARTGVPSKYLRKLSKRKYIFWNKAQVMEAGLPVSVKSDRGDKGLVFVPTPGKNEPRNFVMYPTRTKKAMRFNPGKEVMGNFTAFWVMWWNTEGAVLMEQQMRADVTKDIEMAELEAERKAKAHSLRPVQTTNLSTIFAKAKAAGRRFLWTR